MNIGKFNNRITIENRTITKVKGVPTDVWNTFYSCWCSVNSLFGTELYKALEIQQENVLNFTVRYSKNLEILNTKDYRINWKNRVFNIISIDFHGFTKEKITIKAKEIV
jgi:SPP1 family predicted phage head-tail adaptor